MFLVISYDIPHTKRRTQVMKLLKNYGQHAQYSVFECDLTPPQIDQLRQQLLRLLHPATDSLRIYYLAEDDARRVERLAGRGVARDPVLYMC
jgi:CRISPR-associated protein Cas2